MRRRSNRPGSRCREVLDLLGCFSGRPLRDRAANDLETALQNKKRDCGPDNQIREGIPIPLIASADVAASTCAPSNRVVLDVLAEDFERSLAVAKKNVMQRAVIRPFIYESCGPTIVNSDGYALSAQSVSGQPQGGSRARLIQFYSPPQSS